MAVERIAIILTLRRLQQFPIFVGPSEVWDYNGSTNQGGYSQGFEHLFPYHPMLVAAFQMVFYTVIATQDRRGYEPQQFLGFGIQSPGAVSVGVQIEYPLDHLVIASQKFLVHPGTVCIEILNWI